jgi:crotonobetainyl-CoA:carnitine CoA-transferase CaiB-like acyl-CoA transferase
MDPVLQAFTGLMNDNKGEDGIPHRVPFVVIDMTTALYAFQALSAALYARRSETRGRRIEVSLLQAASAIQVIRMMMVYLEGEQVRRVMPSGVFKTSDGWLQFLVVRNDSWVRFCAALGRPQLATDPRFDDDDARHRNESELMAIVRPAIAEKSTQYWLEHLREADIMHERLNTFREFVRQPQAEAINLFSWLEPGATPEPIPMPNIAGIAPFLKGTPRATSPLLGQHTTEILSEHGFTAGDIASLLERKTVAQKA